MNRSQEGAEEKSVEMWEKLGENGVEKRPQPLNQISNNVKQTLTQTHTVKQRFGEGNGKGERHPAGSLKIQGTGKNYKQDILTKKCCLKNA